MIEELNNKDKQIESSNFSKKIDKIENKILKSLLSFILICLMLIWNIIPNIILYILKIDVDTLSNTTKYLITIINDLLFISLLTSIYYKTIKDNLYKYFNNNLKDNLKTSLKYWLVGFIIMLLSNYIIAIVTNGQLAENEEAVREMINLSPLYMTFQILIYAPLTEELIFRKSIKDIFDNKIIYAIISGVIFGGLHAISSITDFTSLLYLIPYCSLGIVFGFLYAKTDNIFSSITAHAIHNSLALIVYFTSL